MRSPTTASRRAPALACAALLIAALCATRASAQTFVFLVRHAEPVADGGSKDPGLSPKGKERAERLAGMLARSGVAAVFTSEFKRTQETAKPLATKLHVASTVVPADDVSALVAKVKEHPTEAVLIAGHSDTVPEIIAAIDGPPVVIPHDEFGNLFIFVPATKALTRIDY